MHAYAFTHTHAHTKTLKIHIHLPFLNFFLGSGLMCQFSLRYVLLSSQQFFPNSSHSFFEMCFSLFPSKSLACPWQAVQLISFLIPFQLNSLIPSLKHPLMVSIIFFFISPSHLSAGVFIRASNSLQHINGKPIRINILHIHRLCK